MLPSRVMCDIFCQILAPCTTVRCIARDTGYAILISVWIDKFQNANCPKACDWLKVSNTNVRRVASLQGDLRKAGIFLICIDIT